MPYWVLNLNCCGNFGACFSLEEEGMQGKPARLSLLLE
jgi:hypothetical protein